MAGERVATAGQTSLVQCVAKLSPSTKRALLGQDDSCYFGLVEPANSSPLLAFVRAEEMPETRLLTQFQLMEHILFFKALYCVLQDITYTVSMYLVQMEKCVIILNDCKFVSGVTWMFLFLPGVSP